MRTSATYMFDKADNCVAVSLDEDSATIEFRGDEGGKSVRKHYIRISGLSSKVCKELAEQLASAATFLVRRKVLDVPALLAKLTKTKATDWKETKGVSSGAVDWWYVHRSRGTLIWACLDDLALTIALQTSETEVQADGPEKLFHCSNIFKDKTLKPFLRR